MVNIPPHYNNEEDVLDAIRQHQNYCAYCMFRRYYEFYRNIPLEDRQRFLLIPEDEMQQIEILYQNTNFQNIGEEILETQNHEEESIDR